jgi:hypothetical protein
MTNRKPSFGTSFRSCVTLKMHFLSFCWFFFVRTFPLQPLFCAFEGGCSLEVIQTIYDSCPNAILQRDNCGHVPLHSLFHPKMDHRILEYVLSHDPSLAAYKEPCFSGQSLLQRVFSPWIAITNQTTSAPRRLHGNQGTSWARNGNIRAGGHHPAIISRSQLDSNQTWKDHWAKLVLTLRAAYRHSLMMTRRKDEAGNGGHLSYYDIAAIPELHLAMMFPCPPVIVCQFIELYPEQATIPMAATTRYPMNGIPSSNHEAIPCDPIIPSKTKPLHASGPKHGNTKNESRCHDDVWDDNRSGTAADDLPLHFFLSQFRRATSSVAGHSGPEGRHHRRLHRNPASACPPTLAVFHPSLHGAVLRGLVRAYPKAAGVRRSCGSNANHQLPVHMAISAGILWDSGLRELVYADPSVLDQAGDVYDEPSSAGRPLLPFMHASAMSAPSVNEAAAADDTKFVLDTVYCLLRENPAVLSGCH